MAASRLTALAVAAAGAALALTAFSQTVAEVTPYFVGGIQPAQRFAVIASGDFVPAGSRWSRELFLNDCIDVPRTVYGLAQPPARRDAFLDTCRKHAREIAAATPTASSAWLVIATSSGDLDDLEAMLPALAASARTAPALEWLADRRSRLAEQHYAQLDAAALADYRKDIAVLASGRQGIAVLAQRYARAPQHRDLYAQAVEDTGSWQQQRFVALVRQQMAGQK